MSTEKYDVLFVHLNEKITPLGHSSSRSLSKARSFGVRLTDSTPDKTTHKEAYAKWEVKDTQVMTWITNSIEPNIILNLKPFTTVAKM